jgi:hypothetical protein
MSQPEAAAASVEEVDLAGDGLFAFLFFGGDPRIQGRAFQDPLACRRGRGAAGGVRAGLGLAAGTVEYAGVIRWLAIRVPFPRDMELGSK